MGVTLAWTFQLVAQRVSSKGDPTGSPVFQRKMPERSGQSVVVGIPNRAPRGQRTVLRLHEARGYPSMEKCYINLSFRICPVIATKKRKWVGGVPAPAPALQAIEHLRGRPV